MRALAHPVRMAILTHLQRHGPGTATSLAPVVGASPSVASWHLRHLATFGLVENCDVGSDARRRWWRAAARGFRFALPPGQEGSQAYGMLAGQLFETSVRWAQTWRQEVEPQLSDDWRELSGTSNTRVSVSRQELEHIEDEIEKLIAPYVTRGPEEVPPGARSARLLRIYMPAATDEASAGVGNAETQP
jgi:DNA-binding transcriptional ArsR family regulator